LQPYPDRKSKQDSSRIINADLKILWYVSDKVRTRPYIKTYTWNVIRNSRGCR
jgi:hypothetical protein